MKLYILFIMILLPYIAICQNQSQRFIRSSLLYEKDFLNMRHQAIGEIGVVAPKFNPEAGLCQNPALLLNTDSVFGVSLGYGPKGVAKAYGFNGFGAINNKNSFGISTQYIDFGSVRYSDTGRFYNFTALVQKVSWAHRFNNSISAGIALKYMKEGHDVPQLFINAIHTFALDLGMVWTKTYKIGIDTYMDFQVGASLNDFGPKISYTTIDSIPDQFQSTRLAIGLLANPIFVLDNFLSLNVSIAYQAEKLLVPTPPVYKDDGSGEILAGYDSNISPLKALYQSFYDAPDGLSEELNEIEHKLAIEGLLHYEDKAYLAIRLSKIVMHASKGTDVNGLGLGVGLFGFYLDYGLTKYNLPYWIKNPWGLTLGYRSKFDKLFRFN